MEPRGVPEVLPPPECLALRRRALRRAAAVGGPVALVVAGGAALLSSTETVVWALAPQLGCVTAMLAYIVVTFDPSILAGTAARDSVRTARTRAGRLRGAVVRGRLDGLTPAEHAALVPWAEARWTQHTLTIPVSALIATSFWFYGGAVLLDPGSGWPRLAILLSTVGLTAAFLLAVRDRRRIEAFLRDRGSMPEAAR